jgi:hypothetical protein
VQNPINAGNRKIIVFTAFADTASTCTNNLRAGPRPARHRNAALVTGSGAIRPPAQPAQGHEQRPDRVFAPRQGAPAEEWPAEGELDLLIATDCISEGQNLQDCDWLINYDIHWNPVRIIQRFGRIDRIGSPNSRIQLVNFWPNMELEEYINLEQRVSGRMVLLDISATGEENLIEQQSGNQMNDLEYRRKQLLKLQDAVIDLEDLSSGVSITDLTLTDFRIDLAQLPQGAPRQAGRPAAGCSLRRHHQHRCRHSTGRHFLPAGRRCGSGKNPSTRLPPGAALPGARGRRRHRAAALHPGQTHSGPAETPEPWAANLPDADACAPVRQAATKQGEDMRHAQRLLAAAVASIVGKSEERAVASLFSPGGTHAMKGEFAGSERL